MSLKTILSMAAPLLGKSSIEPIVNDLCQGLISSKAQIELLPGEVDAALLIYESENVVMTSIVCLDKNDKIVRQVKVQPLKEMLMQLITK